MSRAILAIGLLLTACSGNKPDSDTGPHVATDPFADLEQHGVQACEDPSERTIQPWQRTQLPSAAVEYAWTIAGGAIAGDLDGDGDADVVAPNQAASAGVYLSTGASTFAERFDVLAPFDLSDGTGGSMADYDADGDLDLYITRDLAPNVLLRNDGDLVFVDVTSEAAITGCNVSNATCFHSMSSSWGDYDRDGDLDLVVGNYGFVPHDGTLAPEFNPGDPSFLYRNDGDGTFTDVTGELLPYGSFEGVHDGYTYVASFIDIDLDGWPELYFVNDFGTAYPNVLLANREGVFELDRNARGLDLPMTGMCLGVGDNNADLRPDFFFTEWDKLRYMESHSDIGVWLDTQAMQLGLAPLYPQKVPWGCEFADLDLDGDLDLVVAYGYVRNDGTDAWSNPLLQPDAVYLQGENQFFLDTAPAWGMGDTGVGRGFVLADFNRDGWLDLFKRDPMGPEIVYMSQCGEGGWLQIALRQPKTQNTFAVGATIDVIAGGRTMRRWVMAGGLNFASSPPLDQHFGLGADLATEIIVTWPDGEKSRFTDIVASQRLTITRR